MHLYGKYKGKLLIAMAMDANNEVYPLVFAVVESEQGDMGMVLGMPETICYGPDQSLHHL